MSLTEIAIKRPSLIIVIFTVLSFLGWFSYTQLSYELIPKFSAPVLTVNTIYPGASPSEVENSVTKPIEDGLSGLERIAGIRSSSFEGLSLVVIEFDQNTNIDLLLQEAQRKLSSVQPLLPKQALSPVLNKFASDDIPIMRIGVSSQMPANEFFDIVSDRIKPNLSRVSGVAQVDLIGGQAREIKVKLDKNKLENYKIPVLQVVQAIQQANLDFPTGKIKNNNEQIVIRLAGKFKDLTTLEQLVVATNPVTQTPIKLLEIATVYDGLKDINALSRTNGKDAIGVLIRKQSDANAVKVSEGVQKELDALTKQFADQKLTFKVAQDSSQFTLKAANAVIHDISIAIILVALVMLFFLHSFRNSVIVMIAIPASLVSTFIGMYVFNFTLNLMSLLAMSLVIGILVDDSIVVLENIYRHLEMGKKRRQAALDGRNEIGFTALSITLVDVVVFLPIAFVGGIISNIMKQFALVVVFSTLMSLFVSFTITPFLASRFSKLEHVNSKTPWGFLIYLFEKLINEITNTYQAVLSWCLRHKITVLVATLAIFFGSFGLVKNGYIGTEFISAGDRGEFIIQLELPKNATLKETNLATRKVEAFFADKKEVVNVFTTVGKTSNVVTGGLNSSNLAEVNVKLIDKELRTQSTKMYAQELKNKLEKILTGVKISANEVSFFGGADDYPIQIILSSSNLDSAMVYAKKVKQMAEKTKGTLEVKLSVEEGNPEIGIDVDKERMAQFGLNMQIVGATLQAAYAGNTDSKYRTGSKEYDINISLDAFDQQSIQDIENLAFVNPQGQTILLKQFANIHETTGATVLERKNRLPSVNVQSQVLGRASGTVGAEIQAAIQKNPPPSGVEVSYDGDLKQQGDAFGSLGIAFFASILFVYLIMVALYDSYLYPFVVLFSIPVAIVGALLALALTLQSLNIFSMLGIVMLVGLVAKNAILLVDFTNQLKKEGYKTFDALMLSGKTRLRPILMTTIAMVIGMLPIAMASGAGAEWKNGLAWALIGGLTSSMLLTLVVVPAIYYIFDNISAFVLKIIHKISPPEPDENL